ncbi:hypothetical protein DCAR_0520290 [Daucus carota subsp. sativus]|uniref:RNA polymerase sigma factor n=2 Tax=Daucus carota subsp. sativus TaxID=79200 RepID=A0A162A0X9_DAUCS|nr:hypothetical protein DCAR_0520290 [Daucus carota subsp. sativus]
MEASKSLLSSSSQFPPRSLPKLFSSALKLHEQPTHVLNSVQTTSLAPTFPSSACTQVQPDDVKPLLQIDKTYQETLDGEQLKTGFTVHEENSTVDPDNFLHEFQQQLLQRQGLWYLLPSSQTGSMPSSTFSDQCGGAINKSTGVEPCDVLALAKEALQASKKAVLLAEDHKPSGANLEESRTISLGSMTSAGFSGEQARTVRSTRRLERQSKKRRYPEKREMFQDKRVNHPRSKSKASDSDDPLRLFTWVPETKKLLTAKEESELIVHIQELMRLEEVKGRLHAQFGREPTLVEWADAVGLTCRALKSQMHCSNKSREKLIYANFRLVVHIAKQFNGRGLNLQDLLQEGSMGLMWSIKKFKPQAGCRFATYAYWWIRQSIRKSIFQHSRTIRLPDSVYGLLYKVTEAKRQCIQEGHHRPTKEQIAARCGITVDKLQRLLCVVRTPLSMEQAVWAEQNTTYQQITADKAVETPKEAVEKQLMRQHVRNLLGVLNPKERKIMQLRYGILGGKSKTLSDIGDVFGLSKERVRQLESRSLYKLRQHLESEGLAAYEELLFRN